MTYHVTLQGVEVEFAPPKITHIVVNHNLKCISYHLSHFRGCRFWGSRFYFCNLYITINSINPHYTAHWGGYVIHTSQKVNCLLYYKGIPGTKRKVLHSMQYVSWFLRFYFKKILPITVRSTFSLVPGIPLLKNNLCS